MAEDFGKVLMRLRHIRYGKHSFRAICPNCGEPVEPDNSIRLDAFGGITNQENATCEKCGRVKMPHDDWVIQRKS